VNVNVETEPVAVQDVPQSTGYTLPQLIRAGALNTTPCQGWGRNSRACALAAAAIALREATS